MSSKCPHCASLLSASEIKEGWCDSCGKRIPSYATTETSPSSGLPASTQKSRMTDYRTASRRDLLNWGGVCAGLDQMAFAVLLTMLSIPLYLLSSEWVGAFAGTLRLLLLFAVLFAAALVVAGQLSLCRAPSESDARVLAIASVLCMVLNLVLLALLPVVGENLHLPGQAGLSPEVLTFLGYFLQGLQLLQFVLFVLFLRQTAASLSSPVLARNVVLFLVVSLLLWVGTLIALHSPTVLQWLAAGLKESLFWTGVALLEGWLLWFSILLFLVSRTIISTVSG